MIEICGDVIRLTRGDSATISVAIANSVTGEDYVMQEGDKLLLTVRKYPFKASAAVVEKELTGGAVFRLAPEDTAGLDLGTYKYDVELRTGRDVYTVVPCSDFVLLPEVTMT